MSKLLVVFGATGQQGGSVINFVLNDPELSKQYSVRAITRTASSPAAQELQKRGVDVVVADLDDPASLPAALATAHSLFIATVSIYDEHIMSRELRQVKAIADTAVAAGAQFIIFSTCVAAERLWGRRVPGFDSKAQAEAYIRTLPVKCAFFAPGMFMQNFLGPNAPRLLHSQEGQEPTYAIANFISPDAQLPLIETVEDSGKYVGAMLADPDKYHGNVFCAATGLYSYQQVVEIITRITGKKTIYAQLPHEEWVKYLPPGFADPMTAMFRFIENPGYYGPQTKEEVEWAVGQARGKLTTFEEFVEKHSQKLFVQ